VRPAGLVAVLASCILAAPIGASASADQLAASGSAPGGRPAKGKLLVASSDLEDPNFARSVILLVAYNADEGAMGVIVNQPTPIKLAKILPGVEGLGGRSDRVWRGGPVLPTSLLTLIRSKKPLDDSESLFEDVRMLTSREAFERTLASKFPGERLRAFAGHAGWGAGQLEAEIARGDWVVMPATSEVVFSSAPDGVWPKLAERAEGEWTFVPPRRAPAVPLALVR
jgi:putative transcriptional regulator